MNETTQITKIIQLNDDIKILKSQNDDLKKENSQYLYLSLLLIILLIMVLYDNMKICIDDDMMFII